VSYTRLNKLANKNNSIPQTTSLNTISRIEDALRSEIEITPEVMRQYLDLLLTLFAVMRNLTFSGIKISELQILILNFVISPSSLMMFNAFLEFQLNHGGTDEAIIKTIKNTRHYICENTQTYSNLMQHYKDFIFFNGGGTLVRKLDSTFNYSQDSLYVNNKNMNSKMIKDPVKLYFFFEYLNNSKKTADNIDKKYQGILDNLINNLILIKLNAAIHKQQFAPLVNNLLEKIQVEMNQDNLPINKLMYVVNLMVNLYNDIQNQLKDAVLQKHRSSIADSILKSLRLLPTKMRDGIKIIEHQTQNDRPAFVALQILKDLSVDVEGRIAARFAK